MSSGPNAAHEADLLDIAEWWWDEAARCGEIGADGLRRFAVERAILFTKAARDV
jgi:hypothetical protein